jgi:hypothetical protein
MKGEEVLESSASGSVIFSKTVPDTDCPNFDVAYP